MLKRLRAIDAAGYPTPTPNSTKSCDMKTEDITVHQDSRKKRVSSHIIHHIIKYMSYYQFRILDPCNFMYL